MCSEEVQEGSWGGGRYEVAGEQQCLGVRGPVCLPPIYGPWAGEHLPGCGPLLLSTVASVRVQQPCPCRIWRGRCHLPSAGGAPSIADAAAALTPASPFSLPFPRSCPPGFPTLGASLVAGGGEWVQAQMEAQ